MTLLMTTDILVASIWLADWWDYVIAAALFFAVVSAIIFIFSQPGEISMSHQRQAAIATGHTDRKTIFENTALRPILWLLLLIAHRLNIGGGKAWLRRKLIAAGSPNYYTAEEYLALSLLLGVSLSIFFEILAFALSQSFSLLAVIFGMVIGLVISLYSIANKASERLRNITRQLPYALDLISLAMGAGATFAEAARTIVSEDRNDPLNVELRAVLAEMELGTTRRQALQNLANRVPIEPMQNLVSSVIQAEELGTPLGDVLEDQATLLRMQRSVRAENRAAVAGVRILVPCLLLVIAVLLTIFGPALVGVASDGLF
jgi:tight adherence protein C